MLTFLKYTIFMFIYSFLGWVAEVIYCSYPKRKFINRGFLFSPLCPIYGFGALLVIILLKPFKELHYGFVFVGIGGAVLTTVLEYVTSYFMESIFHMRWWDYSLKKFNINGRVCLKNTILFMLMSLVIIYFLDPIINGLVDNLSNFSLYFFGTIIIIIFEVDTFFTVAKTIDFVLLINKCEEVIKPDLLRLEKQIKTLTKRFPSLKIKKDKVKDFFNRIKNSDK